jgi:hypothetical protein
MESNDSSYVFISHKCEDHPAAFEIVERLEEHGIRCWIDERDIPLGENWSNRLLQVLSRAAAVVWVKSPASATSEMVIKELGLALDHSQPVIPVEIATVTKEDLGYNWDDFVKLQQVRFDNPGWVGLVAKRILALEGFVPMPPPADGSEPKAPATPSSTPTRRSAPTDGRASHGGNEPFAVINSGGRIYQLDALNGLGESVIEEGDAFATGDTGFVAVSSDASVMATCTPAGQVQLWTLGATDAIEGPVLSDTFPNPQGGLRMLAVDRPLGQAVRVIASAGNSVYSLMQRVSGAWAALLLADGTESIVSSAVVKDDVLLLWASGVTSWASNRSKRPFSLPNVLGIDAAVGADGRYYLAGWGSGTDGSRLVEVVVEVDSGWERVHRASGERAGIVRVIPDIVRQRPGAAETSVAVEADDHSVALLAVA